MMFQADTAFAGELIALVAGTFLLAWVTKQEVCCKTFGKVVAYFTIVASILGMLCTGYYTLRYWKEGDFKRPYSMMSMQGVGGMQGMDVMGSMKGNKGMGMMMNPAMMQEMMNNCPMMKQMMEDGKCMNMMDQKDMPQNNADDHSDHH